MVVKNRPLRTGDTIYFCWLATTYIKSALSDLAINARRFIQFPVSPNRQPVPDFKAQKAAGLAPDHRSGTRSDRRLLNDLSCSQISRNTILTIFFEKKLDFLLDHAILGPGTEADCAKRNLGVTPWDHPTSNLLAEFRQNLPDVMPLASVPAWLFFFARYLLNWRIFRFSDTDRLCRDIGAVCRYERCPVFRAWSRYVYPVPEHSFRRRGKMWNVIQNRALYGTLKGENLPLGGNWGKHIRTWTSMSPDWDESKWLTVIREI